MRTVANCAPRQPLCIVAILYSGNLKTLQIVRQGPTLPHKGSSCVCRSYAIASLRQTCRMLVRGCSACSPCSDKGIAKTAVQFLVMNLLLSASVKLGAQISSKSGIFPTCCGFTAGGIACDGGCTIVPLAPGRT